MSDMIQFAEWQKNDLQSWENKNQTANLMRPKEHQT